MRRNSSSTPYSRSESNSVPPPRPCAERRPTSRILALLMRSSASSLEWNGGYTRSTPSSRRRPWRATRPSGPSTRTTISPGVKRPRRSGRMLVAALARPPGTSTTRARRVAALRDGASSSASRMRSGRPVRRGASRRYATVHATRAWVPSGTMPGSSRTTSSSAGRAASSQSTRAASSSAPSTASRPQGAGTGSNSTRPEAAAAAAARRQVRTGISAGYRHRGQDAVEHAVGRHTLQLDLGPQLDPVPQRRLGDRLDLVRGDELLARQPGPRLGGMEQHGGAAGRHPQPERRGFPGRADDRHDVGLHGRFHRDGGDLLAGAGQVVPAGDRADAERREVVRVHARLVASQHRLLLLGGRIGEHQLEQEAVELGLGQRVGALVLDRVLGGDDQEGVGQLDALPLDRHLPLLHGLQERGLGLGWCSVDLVGQQQVGEHRSLPEPEGAVALLEDHLAEDVGGHQVGSELDPLEAQVEGASQRLDHAPAGRPPGRRPPRPDRRPPWRSPGGRAAPPSAGRPGRIRSAAGAILRCYLAPWALETSVRMVSMAWASATSSASSCGVGGWRAASTRSRSIPVRTATVPATCSGGVPAGSPSRSVSVRRRSPASSAAACPRWRARRSRLPTATTSSDPGMRTAVGSVTGRPSRRLRHSASRRKATTSCTSVSLTRGAIRSLRPLEPPPGGGGRRTTTSGPGAGDSRPTISTALSVLLIRWLTRALAPPSRTTVPLPAGWTTSQAPWPRGKQPCAPAGTLKTIPPGADTLRTPRMAGTAHVGSSSASSRPMRVSPMGSTRVTRELGSATTSVPPCRTQSSRRALRCSLRSSASSSAVPPSDGSSLETETLAPSTRSVSTSALVPFGPGELGSSGRP